ncbi:uncharacterized protein CEXT_652411 [Caerostris extrusa]|uniref:Uncharacterized protein n=1 Tax=Caerostris extrusa TaxID=172846 RepID=A0AAV4Y5Y3_CAEEX|nr:uncharacterized protein CEXT_652411 [Caerostris extrusa]
MSTPLKLNVTFWDMPDRSNNGYAKNSGQVFSKKTLAKYFNPLPVKVSIILVALSVVWVLDATRMIGTVLPFLAVAGVHFWHTVLYRGRLTAEMAHLLLCASVLAEIVGNSVATCFGIWTVIHSGILMLTGILVGQEPTLILYASCRLFLWVCLPWMPDTVRTVLYYASIVMGSLAAKYLEALLVGQIVSDMKPPTPRRRRISNNTVYNVYKMRRTSLPALGGSNKAVHHSFGYQARLVAQG